ncbi:hypothetical protein [Streptomyces sp. NPDC002788]
MGTEEAARTTTGSEALDDRSAGPMVPRLALGARLRRLVEAEPPDETPTVLHRILQET